MASVKLGSKAVGAIVKLKENGTLVDYIVVHKGRPSSIYDASCDGVWLLRKDIAENRVWAANNVNKWESSDIKAYLDGTWINRYDANIKAAIKTVKLPYRKNGGSGGADQTGANGISCKVFFLSGYEVGWTTSNSQYFPVDGAKLDYFESGTGTSANNKRIAYLNGSAARWWLRSPYTDGTIDVWYVHSSGNCGRWGAINSCVVRPALILPSSLLVSDDGSVSTNTAPTTPSSISVPSSIQGGSTITVSWGASTDAESNLEGYILERSTDGGKSWSQVYQGNSRSTTNTVAFGTYSVMYRVRAYDSEGLFSAYKTSGRVLVNNNSAPGAPGSITVPNAVTGGASLTVTWTAASDVDGNLSGYSLERQVDGGDWAVVYSGSTLSYTDAITKGWASVAYRVRAYDTNNAYGPYQTSPTRAVENNTAPSIVSGTASGTDLGTLSEGFELTYHVEDADGDAVTVTEALDGALQRTHTPVLGKESVFKAVSPVEWRTVLNGPHTLKIAANDGRADSAPYTLSFTKAVHAASVTLTKPMEADDKITLCVLSVSGSIPADADYRVEVTNNGLDDAPVWEDCTTEVRNGANHIFDNQTAEKGFAFSFRVRVERGDSGQGGYITSVQGGFQ